MRTEKNQFDESDERREIDEIACGLQGGKLFGQFIKRNGRRLFQVSDEYDSLLSISEPEPQCAENSDIIEQVRLTVLESQDMTWAQQTALLAWIDAIQQIKSGCVRARSARQLAARTLGIDHNALWQRVKRGLANLRGVPYKEMCLLFDNIE